MGQTLKVLALTSTDPELSATWQYRVQSLLPHLQRQGVHVETARLPRRKPTVAEFLSGWSGFDVVWIHRRLFWPAELRALRCVAARLVLDIDDPVKYSSTALFHFSLGRFLRFRATARAVDALLCASDGLVELARPFNPNALFVPLCCEPALHPMCARQRRSDEPLRLVWVGSRSTYKYLDGARLCLEEIGKACKGVELVVVGHTRPVLNNLPVTFVQWRPGEDHAALARCHVGLVPMESNRWTRGKATLKPLQYLASGLPFIGNRVGVNHRLADAGRNGILADSPPEWVDAVQRLKSDEERRFQMGTSGVDYIRQFHTPEVLAARVAAIFRSLTQDFPQRRAA
jgi:glycosyltransferase involved in cell wall biosynthesis